MLPLLSLAAVQLPLAVWCLGGKKLLSCTAKAAVSILGSGPRS